MKKLFYLLLISCFSLSARAQSDSSVLSMHRLQVADIEKVKGDSLVQQVISATRSAIPLSQSPFETYVITKEEIQRFGCNTLIDVLRLVPGIRTSKVGSAMEGELFMANGLRGNSHFQFLINDVPIRPFSIVGMSIGAQFPIKQAERIEIQLGSCATLYGSQAGGGVVNIILKESERPVYTSADLAFGSDKYNNIDVNFGGKIGKGKRIFRFNAYGGFTTVNDVRNKKNDDENFDADKYDPTKKYKETGNFLDDTAGINAITATKIPHFSRYVGFDLKGKYVFLSYLDMTRRDHSAIGLNPAAINYRDGGSYFEDNLSQFTVGLNLNFDKFKLKSCLGFLKYKVSDESSALFLNPQFNKTLDTLLGLSKQYNIPIDKTDNIEFSRFLVGSTRNYFSAYETSFPFETTIAYSFFKKLAISMGFQGNIAVFNESLKTDISHSSNLLSEFSPNINWFGYFMPKIALTYHTESTFVTLNSSSVFGDFGYARNLRFGFDQKIKLFDNDLHFKLNSALGKINPDFRYFQANRGIRFYDGSFPISQWQVGSPSGYSLSQGNLIAQPQVNLGAALAYQYKQSNFSLNYQYFSLKKLYGYYDLKKIESSLPNFREEEYINGFQNMPDSYRKIHKVSFLSVNKQKITKFYAAGFIQSTLAYTRFIGEEKLEDGILPIIRQTPKYMLQYKLYSQPWKRLSFAWNFSSTGLFYSSKTTVKTYESNKESLKAGRFSSVDIFVNYHFNDNLQGQLRIFNLMNNRNTGIEATETPDDLFFNSQPLRTFQLGLKYNLDRQ